MKQARDYWRSKYLEAKNVELTILYQGKPVTKVYHRLSLTFT